MRKVLIAGLAAVLLAGSGVVLAVAPPAAAAGSLVFATFNVCKYDCKAPAPAWSVRRDRVQRVVAESGADVIGLEEATRLKLPSGKTQIEDIKALIAPSGYVPIEVAPKNDACRQPRKPNGHIAGRSPCVNTAMLVYKSATVQPVQPPNGPGAGRTMQKFIAAGLAPGSATRSVEWAYLRGVNGAGPFLVVNLHNDQEQSASAEQSRVALGQALTGWVASLNAASGMPNTPVVLVADLDSFAKRQPEGVQKQLTDAGWQDAFSAPDRVNIQYATIHSKGAEPGSGFPDRPTVYLPTKKDPLRAGTRIDYVMAYGPGVTMLRYENVLHLTPDGAFNPDYQASDHQMVKATIAFA